MSYLGYGKNTSEDKAFDKGYELGCWVGFTFAVGIAVLGYLLIKIFS